MASVDKTHLLNYLVAEMKDARDNMERYRKIYRNKNDKNYIQFKYYESSYCTLERIYNFYK